MRVFLLGRLAVWQRQTTSWVCFTRPSCRFTKPNNFVRMFYSAVLPFDHANQLPESFLLGRLAVWQRQTTYWVCFTRPSCRLTKPNNSVRMYYSAALPFDHAKQLPEGFLLGSLTVWPHIPTSWICFTRPSCRLTTPNNFLRVFCSAVLPFDHTYQLPGYVLLGRLAVWPHQTTSWVCFCRPSWGFFVRPSCHLTTLNNFLGVFYSAVLPFDHSKQLPGYVLRGRLAVWPRQTTSWVCFIRPSCRLTTPNNFLGMFYVAVLPFDHTKQLPGCVLLGRLAVWPHQTTSWVCFTRPSCRLTTPNNFLGMFYSAVLLFDHTKQLPGYVLLGRLAVWPHQTTSWVCFTRPSCRLTTPNNFLGMFYSAVLLFDHTKQLPGYVLLGRLAVWPHQTTSWVCFTRPSCCLTTPNNFLGVFYSAVLPFDHAKQLPGCVLFCSLAVWPSQTTSWVCFTPPSCCLTTPNNILGMFYAAVLLFDHTKQLPGCVLLRRLAVWPHQIISWVCFTRPSCCLTTPNNFLGMFYVAVLLFDHTKQLPGYVLRGRLAVWPHQTTSWVCFTRPSCCLTTTNNFLGMFYVAVLLFDHTKQLPGYVLRGRLAVWPHQTTSWVCFTPPSCCLTTPNNFLRVFCWTVFPFDHTKQLPGYVLLGRLAVWPHQTTSWVCFTRPSCCLTTPNNFLGMFYVAVLLFDHTKQLPGYVLRGRLAVWPHQTTSWVCFTPPSCCLTTPNNFLRVFCWTVFPFDHTKQLPGYVLLGRLAVWPHQTTSWVCFTRPSCCLTTPNNFLGMFYVAVLLFDHTKQLPGCVLFGSLAVWPQQTTSWVCFTPPSCCLTTPNNFLGMFSRPSCCLTTPNNFLGVFYSAVLLFDHTKQFPEGFLLDRLTVWPRQTTSWVCFTRPSCGKLYLPAAIHAAMTCFLNILTVTLGSIV